MLREKTYGNYPAPKHILSCVFEGLQTDIDTGLAIETRYFVNLVRSPEAKNMIRSLFFGMQEANKLARRPPDVPTQKYTKIGMLGAGMMGAGIAHAAATAGIEVVLLDSTQEARREGQGLFGESCWRSASPKVSMTQDGADGHAGAHPSDRRLRRPRRLRAGDRGGVRGPRHQGRRDEEDRGGDRAGRHLRLQHLDPADHRPGRGEQRGRPISSACTSSRRPRRCRWWRSSSARQTSPATLARSMDFVRAIGKTPIVVNDCARLLHQPRIRHLSLGRHGPACGRRRSRR